MVTITSIGVYGFTLHQFIATLQQADVDLLLDVRQRRGVRGPQYCWGNVRRLRAALAEAGIEYRHAPQLAPTTELRHLQYAEDARQGVGKRNRNELCDEYVRRYREEILDKVDLGGLVSELPTSGPTALLCVERDPEACHRSLITQRLDSEFDLPVGHLRPTA